MALEFIKPRELPAQTNVQASDSIPVDNGSVVGKATPVQIANAGAPVASEAEAIAGIDNTKRMTPFRVQQALLNTSGGAVARAQAWAESPTPPDTLLPDSKSSKTWAGVAEDYAAGAAEVLAGAVRFNLAQTLTDPQKLMAWNNIAGARLHANNGYETLPDGLILQWGRAVIPAGGFGSITLPLAFPNNFFAVIASPSDDPTVNYALAPTARVLNKSQLYAVGSVIGAGGVISFSSYNIIFYAVGN